MTSTADSIHGRNEKRLRPWRADKDACVVARACRPCRSALRPGTRTERRSVRDGGKRASGLLLLCDRGATLPTVLGRAAGEFLPPSVFDRRASGPPSPRLRRTGGLSRDREGAGDALGSHVPQRHTRMRSGLRGTRQRAPSSPSRPSVRAGASCRAHAAGELFAAARLNVPRRGRDARAKPQARSGDANRSITRRTAPTGLGPVEPVIDSLGPPNGWRHQGYWVPTLSDSLYREVRDGRSFPSIRRTGR